MLQLPLQQGCTVYLDKPPCIYWKYWYGCDMDYI